MATTKGLSESAPLYFKLKQFYKILRTLCEIYSAVFCNGKHIFNAAAVFALNIYSRLAGDNMTYFKLLVLGNLG